MREAMRWFKLPSFLKRLYIFYIRYIKSDPIYAGLLEGFREKSIQEYYALIARREDYRARWFKKWNEQGLDFLLTVPNALPAVPHGGMKKGFKVCGYTFLFNLVRFLCFILSLEPDLYFYRSSISLLVYFRLPP